MFKAHKKQPGGMRYTPYRDQPPGTIFTDNMVIFYTHSPLFAKNCACDRKKFKMACAFQIITLSAVLSTEAMCTVFIQSNLSRYMNN